MFIHSAQIFTIHFRHVTFQMPDYLLLILEDISSFENSRFPTRAKVMKSNFLILPYDHGDYACGLVKTGSRGLESEGSCESNSRIPFVSIILFWIIKRTIIPLAFFAKKEIIWFYHFYLFEMRSNDLRRKEGRSIDLKYSTEAQLTTTLYLCSCNSLLIDSARVSPQ